MTAKRGKKIILKVQITVKKTGFKLYKPVSLCRQNCSPKVTNAPERSPGTAAIKQWLLFLKMEK